MFAEELLNAAKKELSKLNLILKSFFLGASCPTWNPFVPPRLGTTDVKNFQWSRNLSPLDFLI
jgi:hypothetical protein